MKSTKHSRNFTARLASIAITVALILSVAFSFGFINKPSIARAEEQDVTQSAEKTVNGIRFVQVAAGEDFAIGLTFDGKLYGWSLTGGDGGNTGAENTVTLGKYYSSVPTEIGVTFRQGPGVSGNNKWGEPNYMSDKDSSGNPITDKITSIAATRTTAAFITEKGYIYTWGKDSNAQKENVENVVMEERNAFPHYLLLREAGNNDPWHTPFIINYGYYDETGNPDTALDFITPTGTKGLTLCSIAAGEYNYIFGFAKDVNFYTYAWGSLMYSVPNIIVNAGGYTYDLSHELKGGRIRKVYKTSYANTATNTTVVAGGYTVGVNGSSAANGTSLQLRGKNFLTSAYDSATGYIYTNELLDVTGGTINSGAATSKILYSQSSSAYNLEKGLAGANGRATQSDTYDAGIDIFQYYGRQKSNTELSFSVDSAVVNIVNAQGAALNGANNVGAYNYAVALGNDVGYGISGKKLYGWGDNNKGQLKGFTSAANTATPVQILSDKTFKSVAAGKQLTKSKKALYATDSLQIESGAVTGFISDVQNSAEYITGALSEDGKLYVWSNFDSVSGETNYSASPVQIKFGNVENTTGTTASEFAAVYSGYGNNLFAVTKLGKLIHISYDQESNTYKQKLYDEFRSADGSAITNWSVNSNNTVKFNTVPATAANPAPSIGDATFYVWQADRTSAASEGDNTVWINSNNGAGAFDALVSKNNIGDVYRILTPADDSMTFLNDKKENKPASFAPVYSYDGKVMTESQRENMFDAQIVNTDTDKGVGIKITPLRSSKGEKVTLEFYVARFGSQGNFETSAKGKAIYYDYEKCKIEFTIADTPTIVDYKSFADVIGEDGANKGNSNIPLLDPNNDNNKYYSLAVQNVSLGVEELIKYLTAKNSVDATFKADAITAMSKADSGFPALSKVKNGNLNYYLGENETSASDNKYYTNVYKYIFSDRDADRVIISDTRGIQLNGLAGASVNAINCVKVPVTVKIDLLSTYGVDVGRIKAFATDFNNVYGFYNVVFAEDNSSVSLTYDVVRYTAVGSTGNIVYNENNIADYSAKSDNAHVRTTINAQTSTKYKGTAGDVNIDIAKTTNVASVFAQASLRLTDTKDYNGIYGSAEAGAKNKLTVTYPNRIYVGGSAKIDLSSYVKNLGNSIYFTYNNKITEFDAFNNKFPDETAGTGRPYVKLTSRDLTVSPTSDCTINLDVTVQRFADSRNTPFADDNEKVVITFIFDKITSFTFAKEANVTSEFTVKKTEQISLFGGAIDGTQYNKFASINGIGDDAIKSSLESQIVISDIQSSGDGIYTAEAAQGAPAVVIKPISSGSGIISFVATVYGQSLHFKLAINVSYVTVLNSDFDISLVSDEYVYVSNLQTELNDANKFNAQIGNYKVLYGDIGENKDAAGKNIYNAVYFTENMYGTKDESIGYPAFVKSVMFEGVSSAQPYIRIEPSASAVSNSGEYYMHVRFVNANVEKYADAPNGSILEVVFKISSGKVVVPLTGDKVVNIDCKTGRKQAVGGIWYTSGSGVDTVAHVSAKELLDFLNEEDSMNYQIYFISADSAATKYFNYDYRKGDNEIIITPKYNTPVLKDGPQSFAVSVSVYNAEKARSLMLSFDVTIDGILTTLPVTTNEDGVIGYGNIWLYSFIIVFGVLLIIFIIRMVVYWKKRAKQRALIKRNQELIRMRDRMHNKANIASKEQVVRTKMKMEDPKYAKLFNEMRKNKENESGVVLENSDLAAMAKSKSKKKKKGGKKSVAELKAELEAKKAAFAAAQAQSVQPVNPFGGDAMSDASFDGGGAAYTAPVEEFADGFGGADGGFASPDIDGKEIIFDASDIGDGM